ncbi:MAG: disulfide bond formation protein B [Holosporales bacterium]|jgi:disulfide bond formation protein DsbB|nr:disulfide bond formation protein B [Holosporales bacterium]
MVVKKFFEVPTAHLILLLSSILGAGTSITSQYIFDKQPCELCLISRYIYVMIIIISTLTLKYNNTSFLRKVLFMTVFCSFLAGTYHLGVENRWWAAPKFCTITIPDQEELDKAVPSNFLEGNSAKCDVVNLEIFGLSATLLNILLSSSLFWFISVCYAIDYGRRNFKHM